MSDDSAKLGVYLRLSPSDAEERAGYRVSTLEEPLWGLGPLGRVNLFIGSTSSGKSRLMRSILKQGEYEYHADERHLRSSGIAVTTLDELYGTEKTPGPVKGITIQLRGRWSGRRDVVDNNSEFMLITPQNGYDDHLRSKNRIHQGLKNLATQGGDLNEYRQFLSSWNKTIDAVATAAKNASAINEYSNDTEGFKVRLAALDKLKQSLNTLVEEVNQHCTRGNFSLKWLSRAKPKRIYIPVLRNPNPLQKRDKLDEVFAQTVRNHYDLLHDVDIFTGQELYQQMFDTRNNYEPNIRDRHTEFELFLSSSFFAGARVEVVPAVADEVTNLRRIKIRIGGIERELPSVGDGIQSLIILMYTLFRAEPETHIFIEEPENSLHPGLQRIVLETMLTNEFLRKKNRLKPVLAAPIQIDHLFH